MWCFQLQKKSVSSHFTLNCQIFQKKKKSRLILSKGCIKSEPLLTTLLIRLQEAICSHSLSFSFFFLSLFLVQLTFLYGVLSKSCPLQIGSWLVKGPGASWEKHINSPRARSFSPSPLSFSYTHNWVFVVQEWDDFLKCPSGPALASNL